MTFHSTIRTRLTLWYVLLLGMILVLFSSGLYLILANGLNQQVDDALRVTAEQALGAVSQVHGQISLQNGESENDITNLGQRGLLVRVIDLNGKIVGEGGPFHSLPIPADAVTSALHNQSTFITMPVPGSSTQIRLHTIPYQDHGVILGVVQVGQPLSFLQDTLRRLLVILAVTIPITLVLASLVGLFLASRALGPIDRIARAAQRISAEDLGQRLNLALPDDEVGRLARTFDAMLARLDQAFLSQRQFTADVSHELRTPLAIMKGDISVALNRPRQGDEYRAVLTNMEEQVDRLTRLVDDLLLLARTDTGQPALHIEPLNLADLLHVIVDRMRPLSEAKQLTLTLHIADAMPMNGDTDKLLRLFLNLLDNAIKYTPNGGQITVRASDDSRGGLLVNVSDTGPGIAQEHRARIFERFYRADFSRARASGGSGLGLAIARWIAEVHGGHIDVRGEIGSGSTFSVWLPQSL